MKQKTTDELIQEIKKLRKICRTWQKIVAWDNIANSYHPNVAQVNMGKRPQEPKNI